MRCEVLAIGTELLLGQIIDSNSAWIGEQLALAGIHCYFQTKVGDNIARIDEALQIALARSEAVIVCGGLGPTHDDVTRQALARVMNVPLQRDETLIVRIQERFRARQRDMPLTNLQQADVPQGASIIPQMPGTAPGLICPVGEKVIYAVPGVPFEMREMVLGTVIPDLQRRSGQAAVIKSRTLRTWGQPESGLAELLAARITELDKLGNPTLAFLASGIEGIKIRITAKAATELEVTAILDAEEQRLRHLLGRLVFGVDAQTMESVIVSLLKERNLTLAVAENITGGTLSTRFTAIAGHEPVWRGAVIQGPGTATLLGITPAISLAECARQWADAVRLHLEADVGLAACGVSADAPAWVDPADQPPRYPVGTVFLALAREQGIDEHTVRLPGQRDSLRQFTVISLLNALRLYLQDSFMT